MKRNRHHVYETIVSRLSKVDPRISTTVADGMPGLAVQGAFFAGFDPHDGSLVVKLPEQRMASLVDAGVGHEIDAGGRVHDDWVGIDDPARWGGFADEALQFVASTAA